MKIYHTETQADYDALMSELENRGITWWTGKKATKCDIWHRFKNLTCVKVGKNIDGYCYEEFYKEGFSDFPIIKYKAKADEKMKFTKENVYGLFGDYRRNKNGIHRLDDLESAIMDLDDTPEKVVVPKFVADFYEERANATLEFLITQLEATYSRSELGEWYRSCRGRHRNGRANAQEVIAKMTLDGYTIAPEKIYYIPLPHLETSDGIRQVLSKRSKNGRHYFASRPNENLKQRYTKAELEQVPEIYKPFAKPIEEENE